MNLNKLKYPLIQGGMGVGVSLGNLAGHVALNGAMGVISSAQIGFNEEDFETNTSNANLRALDKEIKKAKTIAKKQGLVAVNIMCALQDYNKHVMQAVKSGADAIISGAGLPLHLPELVKEAKIMLAPIISSSKAARVILKAWSKYKRLPDFFVIEGSQAGGHLGFKEKDLENPKTLLEIFHEVKEVVTNFEKEKNTHIPIFIAGGIYTREDVKEALKHGVDGVQVGTRFITTYECDASTKYKEAYLNLKEEDIVLIHSPVGMPGRAVRNHFIKQVEKENQPVTKCLRCIKTCPIKGIPYCITEALIKSVKGDIDHGLLFTGSNGYRNKKIMHVSELIHELMEDQDENSTHV